MLQTKDVAMQIGFSVRSYIIVAASYYYEKWFFLNSTNKQLYVGTRNLLSDGEMLPCVPQALLRQTSDVNNDITQDALLLWLEEQCRRLQGGMIKTQMLHKMQTIRLYPETPPACSVAVTNGVQTSELLPKCSNGLRRKETFERAEKLIEEEQESTNVRCAEYLSGLKDIHCHLETKLADYSS
ncbi:uncharacterized protein A4U43_C05F30740 [Asparagus officinalis]|uniref:Uncharacterized protein n=1 Tax=Asparagus officinalis TaxID=4686 RepID=A0A5P1EY76_ASPOF|nr:uncharacterized protein A4U43_C05F30740 [Asparagus officinalis]